MFYTGASDVTSGPFSHLQISTRVDSENKHVWKQMPEKSHHLMHAYILTYIHTYYEHTYINTTNIHTYIHTCIHTYIHIYIHNSNNIYRQQSYYPIVKESQKPQKPYRRNQEKKQ